MIIYLIIILFMRTFYKSAFKKYIKKQSRAFQLAAEDEIEKIIGDPDAGEAKKGDLGGFRVHKFKFQRQEYLIAYETQGEDMIVYMIGPHENFYRELKKYLRETE